MYVHTHIHTYTYIQTYIYTNPHAITLTFVCVCTHKYIQVVFCVSLPSIVDSLVKKKSRPGSHNNGNTTPTFQNYIKWLKGAGIWPILNDPVQVLYLRQRTERFKGSGEVPDPRQAATSQGPRGIYTASSSATVAPVVCLLGLSLPTSPASVFYKGPFSHTEHL